jgi:hypothetical protein
MADFLEFRVERTVTLLATPRRQSVVGFGILGEILE